MTDNIVVVFEDALIFHILYRFSGTGAVMDVGPTIWTAITDGED